MFQGSFRGVLRTLASFKGALKLFQGSFLSVSSKFAGGSRKFQEWFKIVKKTFQRSVMEISKKLRGKKVSWLFQGNFKGVSRVSRVIQEAF